MLLPRLKLLCDDLGVGQKLPFVQLPVELNDESLKDWQFLETFHIGIEANVTFYLEILGQIVRSSKASNTGLTAKGESDLFTVYGAIEKLCKAADHSPIWYVSRSFRSSV